jgi:(E)-4-hydroxy-3-methylbut-2-enyl-diphosphate synthase
MTLRGEGIAEDFTRIVDDYVIRRFGGGEKGEAAE